MKACVLLLASLGLLMVLVAGCASAPPEATPVPTTVPSTAPPTATPTFSFTLGEKYLEKKYSFTGQKVPYREEFRATNDPWGIEFTVNPTNEDPQYTWFNMTLTQLDTGRTDSFGYGRIYALDRHQMYPMYTSGPYLVELTGDRVSVTVTIAKRNP